jgi:hypothetical protein
MDCELCLEECKSCLEELTSDKKVFYRSCISDKFIEFDYCIGCLNEMMCVQWDNYIDGLKTADCMRSLRILIEMGPPINFRDNMINDGKEIYEFYFDGKIQSARLKNNMDICSVDILRIKLLNIVNILDDIEHVTVIGEILNEFNL